MKNSIGNTMKVFSHRRMANLAMVCLVPFALTGPVYATSGTDDVGMYGSRTISNLADKAARALEIGRWADAQVLYKQLMAKRPGEDDFYFGYYKASRKMNQWAEVGLALEQLFQHNPRYKNKMLYEYGECLYNLNRYSDAEPVLRKALQKVSERSIVDKQIKKLIKKGIIEHKPVKGEYKEPEYIIHEAPKPYEEIPEAQIHPGTSPVELKLKYAFTRSESVVVADYKGYEVRKGHLTFYRPPKAHYRIVERLKGPPLNKALPIRYEFHDKTNTTKPKGWKFDEASMMPEEGSRWILFIRNGVPVDRMFETYHGSYGRLEYNDDNIDKVLQIREHHKGQTH